MIYLCLLILSLSAAVVSFDESSGGSRVAIQVSEGAGTVEVVLVLNKAVGQEVTLTTDGSARGWLNLLIILFRC